MLALLAGCGSKSHHSAARLVAIGVTPTNPSIAAGTTQPFMATGTYSDASTKDLTSLVAWSSSDLLVATVSNAAGQNGLATGVGVGTTTVSATFSGISGTTNLTADIGNTHILALRRAP